MGFLVSAALGALVVVGVIMLCKANAERRTVLERNIGRTLTIVTLEGKLTTSGMTGRVQRLDDNDVVVLYKGHATPIPIASIQEIWQGRRRLGRW